jgi:putative ABC transport system permease protein
VAGLTEVDGLLRNDIVRRQGMSVVGLDPVAFGAATAGSADPLAIPTELARMDWGSTTGTETDPVPVIASTDLAGRARLAVGDLAFARVAGIETAVRVVALAEILPGSPRTPTFLVAPIGAMAVVFAGVQLDPTSYLVAGDASLGPALAAATAPYGDLVHVRDRDAAYRELHETPLIALVEAGMGVALVVGVGYAGLALLAGLTIALAVRRRDLHVLRTLGLGRGGISSTIVIEQVPLLLVALIGGGLVGVGLAMAIGPSVGLAAFTDGRPAIPMVVDPLATVAVGILPMTVGIVAAVLSSWFLRRTDLARAVRFNEG